MKNDTTIHDSAYYPPPTEPAPVHTVIRLVPVDGTRYAYDIAITVHDREYGSSGVLSASDRVEATLMVYSKAVDRLSTVIADLSKPVTP